MTPERHAPWSPYRPAHPGPALAFGDRQAATNLDINSLYDQLSAVTSTLKSLESVDSGKFYHRTAFVGMKNLALAATVCSPMTYEVAEDDSFYFILPFAGQASASCEKKRYLASPSLGAAITPGHARKGGMSDMSMLQATLSPERLKFTAATMLGPAFQRQIKDRLDAPKLVALQTDHLRFDQLFTTICKTIDDCGLRAETLNALGVDDLFYRSVVSMAFPDLIANGRAQSPGLAALNRVCEYIDAHLTETIYLTELEVIGQLSTRSLQYAFQRQFGCTPTAWIRERRLRLAHHRLQNAHPDETVTSIAMECGFPKPSDFSRWYLLYYGQSPKSTLSKAAG